MGALNLFLLFSFLLEGTIVVRASRAFFRFGLGSVFVFVFWVGFLSDNAARWTLRFPRRSVPCVLVLFLNTDK
jgi:hypothetical protein